MLFNVSIVLVVFVFIFVFVVLASRYFDEHPDSRMTCLVALGTEQHGHHLCGRFTSDRWCLSIEPVVTNDILFSKHPDGPAVTDDGPRTPVANSRDTQTE